MHFNSNAGVRNPGPRKVKRVSDINALGSAPIPNNQFVSSGAAPMESIQTEVPFQQNPNINPGTYNTNNINQEFNYGGQHTPQHMGGQTPQHMGQQNPSFNQTNIPFGYPNQNTMQQGGGGGMPQQKMNQGEFAPGINMFQQPIVQDMAMQYGQKLADQGKQLVESQFEKWIPVTRLKYYFAVDNKYVINKLRLLFFPFTNKDWSVKFDQDNPVQPRYDMNAPDLYIPTMAYITYVVLAGLMLGMQNRFTPEQLGMQASSALAYSIFEMIIYTLTLYIANIPTNFKTLDLVAFSGYKFVIMVACVSTSILFYSSGYYLALIYCSISLGFFLLRTLRTKVLNDAANAQTAPAGGLNYDPYGTPQPSTQFDYSVGKKRKLYFLFLIIGIQTFLTFWLSKHLVLYSSTKTAEKSL